jgi:hypothetical protein
MRKLTADPKPAFDLRREMNDLIALRAEVAKLQRTARHPARAVLDDVQGEMIAKQPLPPWFQDVMTRLQRRHGVF